MAALAGRRSCRRDWQRPSRGPRPDRGCQYRRQRARRTCPFPRAPTFGVGATWAPDQSALVVAACLPCNEALEEGQPATAENHDHLYVVPVDGSPVRELLDDTGGWFWTPFWSPDGSTFATVRRECASPEAAPNCSNPDITSSLVLVAAENGSSRVLVTSDQLGEGLTEIGLPLWSRDGGRIAFDGRQSERGRTTRLRDRRRWDESRRPRSRKPEPVVAGRGVDPGQPISGEEASPSRIMRPDGSDARSLGSFLRSFFGERRRRVRSLRSKPERSSSSPGAARRDAVMSAHAPQAVHSEGPLPHNSSTRVTQWQQWAHSILWWSDRRYHQMLWFLLDATWCASYNLRPENTASGIGAGPIPRATGSPSHRPQRSAEGRPDHGPIRHPDEGRQRHRDTRDDQRTQRQRSRERDEDGELGLSPAHRGREAELAGADDRAALHAPRRPPVRHRRVGHPRGDHHQRAGRGGLRAEGPRDPEGLVAAGDPGRGQQVLPRPSRHAGARAQRQADDRPRRGHDRRLGHQGRLLRDR